MQMSICLAIMAVSIAVLIVIGCIAGRERNRDVSVLMFSSLKEANRAASIAAWELRDTAVVSQPRYVAQINHYFVLIEELAPEGQTVAGESLDGVR